MTAANLQGLYSAFQACKAICFRFKGLFRFTVATMFWSLGYPGWFWAEKISSVLISGLHKVVFGAVEFSLFVPSRIELVLKAERSSILEIDYKIK